MHTYIFGETPGLVILGEKYTTFTRNSESDAEDAVKSFKHKILFRLSNRDSFVSWKKTYKMLMRLKVARKEFRKLEMRVDYEKCCNRKRMGNSRGC